jgi:thioredoxin-like negative regulator of GroEL
MLEEALTKPALKRPEEIRLRLAVAYAQAGQVDKARKLLAAVKADDGGSEIARLWLLHLDRQPAAK